MIKVKVWKIGKTFSIGKNLSFIEGKSYFSTISKNGIDEVFKSEEGIWVPIPIKKKLMSIDTSYQLMQQTNSFYTHIIYMKNKATINFYLNPNDYLELAFYKKLSCIKDVSNYSKKSGECIEVCVLQNYNLV